MILKVRKKVRGVGVNDSDYVVQEFIEVAEKKNGKRFRKLIWSCPFYNAWVGLLTRCYSLKYQEKNPTYKDCTVCEEWLLFSNFKRWMESQDWEDKQLDKDLLFQGNKLYSPETCVFVKPEINRFVLERNACRGEFLIGVRWQEKCKKFMARANDGVRTVYLGLYNTELEAHKAWIAFKLKKAKLLAAEQTDPRIAKSLTDRYENYTAH